MKVMQDLNTSNSLGPSNEYFAYPSGTAGTDGTDSTAGTAGTDDSTELERRLRLAIAVLCECGENTVAPDGDDDDSNDGKKYILRVYENAF